MFEKIKKLGEKAKDTISATATLVGDLNGDGKVDEQDARIAAEWAKKTATSIGDEAAKLGKHAMRSDLAKDAATGAAIGAAVAIPVPVVGPMAGAVVGAGLGVYKNLSRKPSTASAALGVSDNKPDIHAELLKLDELYQKNILSKEEFEAQKKIILDARI